MISIRHLTVPGKHLKCVAVLSSIFNCNTPHSNGNCQSPNLIPSRFFYEDSRKGNIRYVEQPKIELLERIPHGYSIVKQDIKLWLKEMEEKFRYDPKIFKHGDTDVIFRFDSEENLKKWKIISDSMHNEGFSHCQLEMNNHGKAVFSGVIDTTIPKDGRIRRAGYCAMKSLEKRKSFHRQDTYNWYPFTHLEFRVRGDGRTYVIGLSTSANVDVNWLDLFTYALHTRGGPYWQTVKIPFSKFFLSNKSCIQDTQYPFRKDSINAVSIMCTKVPGPFKLEIDYIGVHKDDLAFEEFAYEMYEIPKDLVS